jgi:hypothetical protein
MVLVEAFASFPREGLGNAFFEVETPFRGEGIFMPRSRISEAAAGNRGAGGWAGEPFKIQ